MTILVTGACGFIGSAIIKELSSRYRYWKHKDSDKYILNIIALDCKNYDYSSINDGEYYKNWCDIIVSKVDLNNKARVKSIIALYEPDIVIHAAGGLGNNKESIGNSVCSTSVLVEAIEELYRENKTTILNISSYLAASRLQFNSSPYAASKIACEALINSLYSKYGGSIYNLRLTSVYGPGQHYGLIHTAFCGIITELPIIGSLYQQRDYIYIDDAATMIANTAFSVDSCKLSDGGIITMPISTTNTINTYELYKLLENTCGKQFSIINTKKDFLVDYDIDLSVYNRYSNMISYHNRYTALQNTYNTYKKF